MSIATAKRSFLSDAFYPNGGDATGLIGMIPQSLDVEDMQRDASQERMQEALSGPDMDAVIKMVNWYFEVVEEIETTPLSLLPRRAREQHMIMFFFAGREHLEEVKREEKRSGKQR